MVLEVCAANYQSAVNAEKGGADRIELCSELGVGGLTPSYGLISKVKQNLSIPIFVLIRPRSGSFVYTEDELDIMISDIQVCKELGCNGIVSGALQVNSEIDVNFTKLLVEASRPLPFTFHRAFDLTPDPFQSIDKLIAIGVERVLSSGQKSAAADGIDMLSKLHSFSNGRIMVLPGAGISSENVDLFISTGFKEIHSSASSIAREFKQQEISFISSKFLDEKSEFQSDVELIKQLKEKISRNNTSN